MRVWCTLALVTLIMSLETSDACTAFYCVNSCGSPAPSVSPDQGFKLILAVNRDEAVDRPTISAGIWPPKTVDPPRLMSPASNKAMVECDQSKQEAPFNLCVYGPLDVATKLPPELYSTWIGILSLFIYLFANMLKKNHMHKLVIHFFYF